MRVIRDAEVAEIVTMREAVVAMAAAFEQFGNGSGSIAPRVRAAADHGGKATAIATMGAALPASGVVGAKVYSTVGGQFSFVIVLFSSITGEALAVVEANEITRFRTAAATAVAVQLCSARMSSGGVLKPMTTRSAHFRRCARSAVFPDTDYAVARIGASEYS